MLCVWRLFLKLLSLKQYKIMIYSIIGIGSISTPKTYNLFLNEKLLSDIENILERNLLMRDEDSETVEKITELFKNSERTQLKWHFKNR